MISEKIVPLRSNIENTGIESESLQLELQEFGKHRHRDTLSPFEITKTWKM